jgi:predicted acetyltransferase
MEKITLIRPNKELEYEAIDFRNEFFKNNEYEINGGRLLDKTDDYKIWFETVSKNTTIETVKENWIVTDTFFVIRDYDKIIIGIIDFRHELNEFLKDFGHCGYSVRPSERKKGYATEMLKQLLEIARKKGLKTFQL